VDEPVRAVDVRPDLRALLELVGEQLGLGAAVSIGKTLLASRDPPSRSTSSATRGGGTPRLGAGLRSLSATPRGRVWSTGPDDCSRSFKGLVRQA
jgi:hypothetical protein